MFPVHPASYRKTHRLTKTDPIPSVKVHDRLKDIQAELDKEDELCFVRTTAHFFLGEITLENYFDRLIGHIEQGAVRHSCDKAKLTNLVELLEVDLIAGVVKSLMLNKSFRRLDEADATKFKKLCILTYRTANLETLLQEAEALQAPLNSLPKRWHEVLAIIAYARRHVSVLQHIVTYPGPSAKTAFDLLGTAVLRRRQDQDLSFQHSVESPDDRVIEMQMWAALLWPKNGWVHFPMSDGRDSLHAALAGLLDFSDEQAHLRGSPEVEKLCIVFSQIGYMISGRAISTLLSLKSGLSKDFPSDIEPCTLQQAKTFVSCFPLSRRKQWVTGISSHGGISAELLLPVSQWSKKNPDRLVVMRLLLEDGYDPNGKFDYSYSHVRLNETQKQTPLQLAMARNDTAMVKLLKEFGAREELASDDKIKGAMVRGQFMVGWEPYDLDGEAERAIRARRTGGNQLSANSGIDDEPPGIDFFG